MDALLKIIELHDGSQTALADHLKSLFPERTITQGHISNWINRDGKVPPDWIIPCSQAVNYEVTPHHLSASLYPHKFDGIPLHLRFETIEE
jgi:hypothetical protein